MRRKIYLVCAIIFFVIFCLSLHFSVPTAKKAPLVLAKPSLAFAVSGLKEYSLYTKEGVFVGTTESLSLPAIAVTESFDVSRAPFVTELALGIREIFSMPEMSIHDNSLFVKTQDGMSVVYPLSGDLDLLLGKTIVVFSQLKESPQEFIIRVSQGLPKKVTEVDFRFTNPVLR